MSCVSEAEQQQALSDVRSIILAAGEQALISRSIVGERLYGMDAAEYTLVGSIPIESLPTPPEELAQKIDSIAHVLSDADVQEQDRLLIAGVTYRIQAIRPERWFGVVTHQVLSLVRLHGS